VEPDLPQEGVEMKTISFSEFKRLSTRDIEGSECLKVTTDGTLVFYAVVKPQGEMRNRIEAICSQIDAGMGTVPEVDSTPLYKLINNYRNGNVADPREARKSLLAMGVLEKVLDGQADFVLDSEQALETAISEIDSGSIAETVSA
jgi:hypothetical protein